MSSTLSGGPLSRKIGDFRRKAVSLDETPLVKSRPLTPGQRFIQVYEPASDDVDLASWVKHNREQLEADLLVHGALSFSGFPIKSVADFEQVTQAFYGE